MTESMGEQQPIKRASYAELARLFLRMSVLAFGGPMAHIAMGEDEIVTRRGWLTRQHFLDLIAATNLIPGPNSTEVIIHVGYVMRGIPGAILAGLCFILPAFAITLVLTGLYVSTGTIPQVEAIFWGIKPVIVAIIAVAGVRLMPSALKNRPLQVVYGLCIAALIVFDLPELFVLLVAGISYALFKRFGGGVFTFSLVGAWQTAAVTFNELRVTFMPSLQMWTGILQTAVIPAVVVAAGDLFWYFLRIGSILFGSGYLLIAYIQQDLVNTYGWLSAQQVLDLVAIGQFTPGPLLTTAGAVGYVLAGVPGAIAALVGVFLPAFVFVILSAPLIPRMRRSIFLSAFLDGVNAAVLAAILLTIIDLGLVALIPLAEGVEAVAPISFVSLIVALVAFVAIYRFKINATWLIVLGGAVGFVMGL